MVEGGGSTKRNQQQLVSIGTTIKNNPIPLKTNAPDLFHFGTKLQLVLTCSSSVNKTQTNMMVGDVEEKCWMG